MKKILLLALSLAAAVGVYAQETDEAIANAYPGYELIFHDEFGYDQGHRNNEAQGYTYKTRKNANVKDGNLIISAYKENTTVNGTSYQYSSASLVSKVKQDPSQNRAGWKYVRIEVRAKIPCALGNWPAIWMLGADPSWIAWPYSGEIDIMEYYPSDGKEAIHANACWGDGWSQWGQTWNSKVKYVSDLVKKDKDWRDKYHVWRCDWDHDYIRIYCLMPRRATCGGATVIWLRTTIHSATNPCICSSTLPWEEITEDHFQTSRIRSATISIMYGYIPRRRLQVSGL